MAFQYNMDKIFEDLQRQLREKQEQQEQQDQKLEETNENEPIESPEDAPETQEVAPATSKTTEDKHGGDEVAKEIKNSPNSAENGENSEKENKMQSENQEGGAHKKLEEFFAQKQQEKEDFRQNHKEEYLKKTVIEIVKKIALKHVGVDEQDGLDTYNKRQIVEHLIKQETYKIPKDKVDLKDARYIQFFIDTSGVYGSANRILNELMPQVVQILELQGYECQIAACGNGFYARDMVEDEYYGTRKTLEGYRAGKVSKIACPTPQTAAKMANEAEFSIILADFDGLSSICEMANLCQKDKVPYFLCTEERYPWEDPTLHDWVDPDLWEYDFQRVYDVSQRGNPTLEQYETWQEEYEYDNYDYEDDNDYDYEEEDDYEYDD